ncbi:hypothetical protein DXT99_06620 [Pontibacter diazotrophicus]|uniref:Uncharacterized protein n=1 Tax=Pontibacter diazotrophicus TaxID=1400979 RepID=A0A3D8LFL1_9BACT|nr:hypothetical protein DXT99_06620 [Pontibacter diazotrophicus]
MLFGDSIEHNEYKFTWKRKRWKFVSDLKNQRQLLQKTKTSAGAAFDSARAFHHLPAFSKRSWQVMKL